MQKRTNRVGGKLRAVKSGLGKAAERCGKRFGRDLTGFRECAATELLGDKRSAGDGRCAAAAQKTRFSNPARFEPREEFENITTNGIGRFDGCSSAGQFAGVARIAEVIENGFAEHGRSMAKRVAQVQRGAKPRRRNSTQRTQRAQRSQRRESAVHTARPDYFFAGRYFFSIEAMTT